jgi:DNA-directed RNA polymerase specialized sigma24 family protein
MDELVKYMRALVALQLRALSSDDEPQAKPEILLNQAGFTAREIAELTGRSQAAVAKALSRAKAAGA